MKLAVIPALLALAAPVMAQQSSQPMQHGKSTTQMTTSGLSEPGQALFGALAEVVARLDADPETNWENVDIPALAAHLRDMERVFTASVAKSEPVPNGLRFVVTGDAPVAASIRRMVVAHAATADARTGWDYSAQERMDGAELLVTVPEADIARLKALGFAGILASGMDHRLHHWMIAIGSPPHA